MKGNGAKQNFLLAVIALIPVTWFALLIAPYLSQGLPAIVLHFSEIMDHPFHIIYCKDSLRAVLIVWLFYALGIGIYASEHRNYRHNIEHGSARWGSANRLNRKYANAKNSFHNIILTKHVAISFMVYKHRRNLNIVVIGGSGSGKTRFYVIPNLLQINCSFVGLDPKGELVRSCGGILKEKGYDVKVLDLIHMEKSHGYNPFTYLNKDEDVQKLVTNLFKNTTPKGAQTQDPFWDNAAKMLLSALIYYLIHEAPPEEQNFAMVMEMIRAGDVREDMEDYRSALDILFDKLAMKDSNHIAVKYYSGYHSGAGKTLKSIQISLIARLEKFNISSVEALTQFDELDLNSMGEKKTVLFAVIPDNDTSLNFIVGMLYTQLFQQLYRQADNIHHGSLPVPVHFLMDEFANVALPDDFDKDLATMRSRGISVSIILQNLSQLKALFEKQWESIIGNCDTMLFLGGNDQTTNKYISERLGKETIDFNTYGQSRGRNGSYSKNWQITGRDLMTPDEVRMLDNNYGILFIRGEHPILDEKYDVMQHPNVKDSCLGSGDPYVYGEDKLSIATIQLPPNILEIAASQEPEEHNYAVFCEEEIQDQLRKFNRKNKKHGGNKNE